ncbi:MAG: DUF1134 domain-containing protein [Syntrophobacteraceae bacterium]|jgi:hypothetical protein
MKHSRVLIAISLLAVSLFAFSPGVVFSAEEQMPWDGTVELTGGSVAAGVGFSWGSGVLVYNGKTYKFKIDGLSVGSVGIQNVTARGKVYNLKKVADFSGNFAAVAVGVTVGGGAGSKTMRNERGVIMDLISTNQGVDFTLGAQGVKVTLE